MCVVGVDHDAVAVGDERDRATVDGLGGDVADAEAVRAAGEAAVGDERAVGAAARALHRAGDRQHLAHPRAALRAFVADDDDVARLDLAREDRVHRAASSPSNTRARPSNTHLVEAGDLHHRALRRERAREDVDAALRVDRLGERVHDDAVGTGRIERRRGSRPSSCP